MTPVPIQQYRIYADTRVEMHEIHLSVRIGFLQDLLEMATDCILGSVEENLRGMQEFNAPSSRTNETVQFHCGVVLLSGDPNGQARRHEARANIDD